MTAKALWITTKGELVELDEVSLTALQQAVGGWVQAIGLTDSLTLWLNEEGKLNGLPHNLKGQAIWDSFFGIDTDYIVGNIVLTGGADEDGETLGLDDETVKKLSAVLA
jgi:hypothetical protein